jgi:hypothetical protein
MASNDLRIDWSRSTFSSLSESTFGSEQANVALWTPYFVLPELPTQDRPCGVPTITVFKLLEPQTQCNMTRDYVASAPRLVITQPTRPGSQHGRCVDYSQFQSAALA